MNKKLFLKTLILTLGVLLISCSNGLADKKTSAASNNGKAYIYISDRTSVSRAQTTIAPSAQPDDLADFVLKGKRTNLPDNSAVSEPAEQELTTAAAFSDLQSQKIALDPGTWTFTLEATLNGVGFAGTLADQTISAGSATPLTFELTPKSADKGGLNITVVFPKEASTVHVDFIKEGESEKTIDENYTSNNAAYQIKDYQNNADMRCIEIVSDINDENALNPATYDLTLTFFDSELTESLNTASASVVISGGFTTTHVFVVPALNDAYSITYHNYTEADKPVNYENIVTTSGSTILKYSRKTAEVTLPELSLNGYDFGGWYDNPSFEGSTVTGWVANERSGDLDLYAKWTAIDYSIQYENIDDEDWIEGVTPVKNYTIADSITLPASDKVQRAKANFLGWYTTNPESNDFDATTVITGWNSGVKAEKVVVYAKWQYNPSLDVSIDTGKASILKMAVTVDGAAINENETISAKYSDIAGKSIVFTPTLSDGSSFATAGCTCSWTLDGTTQTVVDDHILSLNTTGWMPGVYDVQFTASNVENAIYESYYEQIIINALIGKKSSPTAVGDIVFNDGSATAYVEGMTLSEKQKDAAVAVIFYKGTECSNDSSIERMLGFGLKNFTQFSDWASNNSTGFTTKFNNIQISKSNAAPTDGTAYYQYECNSSTYYLTGDFDGSDNWSEICLQDPDGTASNALIAQNYRAFDYVNNYASNAGLTGTYATGWYLPTVVELHCIYKNKTSLNTILSLFGDKAATLSNDEYWSSSQYANSDSEACKVDFTSDGNFSNSLKRFSGRVCVIRAF